jgi:hypothetical protein
MPLMGIAGCGDNMSAVQRDYFNVQHEILDGMTQIVDDASAKQFNDAYKNRFQPKEELVKARKDKIENNLFSERDRDDNRKLVGKLLTEDLKGQADSLDFRFRVVQNRLRRLVVKLVEDKAEAEKSRNQSFEVKSTDVCPNLTNLERGEKFTAGGNAGGGLGGGAQMMMPMMQPGGGAAGNGGPPMPNLNAGAGAGGGGQAAAGPTVDPKANENYVFVLGYTFTGDAANPWQQSVRAWKTGNSNISIAPINGIDILPLNY